VFAFLKRLFSAEGKRETELQISALQQRLDWMIDLMPIDSGLPRPDWPAIYRYIENNPTVNESQLWSNVAGTWLEELRAALPHEHTISETENFVLLSANSDHYNKTLLVFLERSRKRLLAIADGICADLGHGKYVVMVFESIDTYYDYISHFGPKDGGITGLSSGMYLNYGYGHFVFQEDRIDMAEPIAAHEMTHALLSHLPIPLWLNEGMAVNMESLIAGTPAERLNQSVFDLHAEFWNEESIQEFWTGDSFFRADEGQRLSYQLAQVLVSNISENYAAFKRFANEAHSSDGGEAAMKQVYGLGLSDLAASFLGEGNWQPRPESWSID